MSFSAQRSLEHLREFSVRFRRLRKLSKILRRRWDVLENHAIMAWRKSHAFEPEKAGRYRYMVVNLQETFVKACLFNKAGLSMVFYFPRGMGGHIWAI